MEQRITEELQSMIEGFHFIMVITIDCINLIVELCESIFEDIVIEIVI